MECGAAVGPPPFLAESVVGASSASPTRGTDVLSGIAGSGGKSRRGRKPKPQRVVGPHRCRTMQKYGFEAGLDFILSLIELPKEDRAQYCAYLAERGVDVAADDKRLSPAPRPVLAGTSASDWVADNLHLKNWDKNDRPLRIKHAAVDVKKGKRTVYPQAQLEYWVEFAASDDVHVLYNRKSGLGVYASRALHGSQCEHASRPAKAGTLACCVVDDACDDEEVLTMGANGAWFGPGALVNSACARCANALFGETTEGKAFIKLRCCVSKGDQILVPYLQKRASACIKCRVPLGDARSMDIDEAALLEE
jgi:hypothetical protein